MADRKTPPALFPLSSDEGPYRTQSGRFAFPPFSFFFPGETDITQSGTLTVFYTNSSPSGKHGRTSGSLLFFPLFCDRKDDS